MKSSLIPLLLAAHAGAALAQYKCTAADGAVTFQQAPCFGAKAEDKLVVVPNGHPPAASGVRAPPASVQAPAAAGADINRRMLANYEHQHQRDALEQALRKAQDDKARRGMQRAQAIAAAQKKFGDDPASAALLKDELTAIDSRYNALGEIDDSKIETAQGALDDWDRAQAASTAPAKR
jgi:hypothetical protein